MPLYIRCVLANKYTLVGYILLMVGIMLMVLKLAFGWPTVGSIALMGVGLGLLFFSRFGLVTLRVYRVLTDEYRRYGGITLGVGRMGYNHKIAVDLVVADIDKKFAKARQEPP